MCTVLIVDDDIEICETYADILTSAGHGTYIARSGADAFRCLPKLVPDIVLLDMQMPDISGLLILSFIRRLTGLSGTKVIIVSGDTNMIRQAETRWGADLCVAKPVSSKQLLNAITRCLDARHGG